MAYKHPMQRSIHDARSLKEIILTTCVRSYGWEGVMLEILNGSVLCLDLSML